MGAPILNRESVNLLRQCVLIADDLHLFGLNKQLLSEGLVRNLADPYKARHLFDSLIEMADWTKAESVRPLLQIFGDAYAECPKTEHSIHKAIDLELAKVGLKIEDASFLKFKK